MTDRELMQQALRYMESIGEMDTYPEDWAIAIALRERLAQPEQEPVAWVYPEALEAFKNGKPWTAYGENGDGPHPDGVKRIPLYLNNDAVAPKAEPRARGSGAGFESLPASPTQQEPVFEIGFGWLDDATKYPRGTKLYTAPRQWQGLTDEEIVLICGECAASHADDLRYARAIEAKLKERNT